MKNYNPVRDEFKTHSRATLAESQRRLQAQVTKRAGDLTMLRVHNAVWAAALELADGDGRRVQIVSESEVIVHNQRVR